MDIHSEEEGVVSFLNGSKLKEDTFKWPLSPDIKDRLQSKYVFHSDVQLQTTNGRSWIAHLRDLLGEMCCEMYQVIL